MFIIRHKVYLIFLMLGLVVSCHQDYVTLSYKVIPAACIANDSTAVLFLLQKKAFKKAKGVARFPDGGQSDYLLEELTLYEFNLRQHDLEKLYDFSDLANEQVNLSTELHKTDSGVLCSVYPNTPWAFYLDNASSELRKSELARLNEQYSDSIVLLIADGIILSRQDGVTPPNLKKDNWYSATLIMNYLDSIPLAEIGLDITSLDSKRRQEWIEECIYLKNDSPLARRAIIEQIIASLSKDEIKALLARMKDYGNNLSGLEKTEYETYSKETYERIKALL